jgi:hypothetical protein
VDRQAGRETTALLLLLLLLLLCGADLIDRPLSAHPMPCVLCTQLRWRFKHPHGVGHSREEAAVQRRVVSGAGNPRNQLDADGKGSGSDVPSAALGLVGVLRRAC